MLLLHALEVDDPEAMAADIKRRYEAPLMEIFESAAAHAVIPDPED